MKTRNSVFIALSMVLLYLVFFPFPLNPELVFRPLWAVAIDDAPVSPDDQGAQVRGYRLGDNVGFVTNRGRLLHTEKRLFDATVNNDFLINYSAISENLLLINRTGKLAGNIEISGYPLFQDERLFVFASDRSKITELSPQGEILWSREYGNIITCMDVTKTHVLLGFLDGQCVLLDGEGRELAAFTTQFSRIECVYGCAISQDLRYIVLIAGLDPQNLIVFELLEGDYKKIRSVEVQDVFRRAVRIRISPDSKHLYYEGRHRLFVHNLQNRRTQELPLPGELVDLNISNATRLVLGLSESGSTFELLVAEPGGNRLYSLGFPSGPSIVETFDEELMVGIMNTLYCYKVEVR